MRFEDKMFTLAGFARGGYAGGPRGGSKQGWLDQAGNVWRPGEVLEAFNAVAAWVHNLGRMGWRIETPEARAQRWREKREDLRNEFQNGHEP